MASIGPLSIAVAFIILGLLSRRLGRVTRSRPYYLGFFLASALVAVGEFIRLALNLAQTAGVLALPQRSIMVALLIGLPAAGMTVGAYVSWYYWSWLLAERG